MEHQDRNRLWDMLFDTDSQSGTARMVALLAAFAVVGGGLSWLLT